MAIKNKNRKLLVDKSKVKRKAVQIPKEKSVLKLKVPTHKPKNKCAALRLEDLFPCEKRVEWEKGMICDLHRNVLKILEKRRKYIFAVINANVEEYKQLRGFVTEHLHKIFPMKKRHRRCRLGLSIWKNNNDFIPGGPDQCVALNLRNGTSICGKEPSKKVDVENWMYCENHTYLKRLHSDLYHTTYDDRAGDGGWAFNEVYRLVKTSNFHKMYVEFFLRLEHLTIFQMEGDDGHIFYTNKVIDTLGNRTLYKMKLPEPKSFYRLLLGKFCDPDRSRQCKKLFDDEPIEVEEKEDDDPKPNLNARVYESEDEETKLKVYEENKPTEEPESEDNWDE